LQRGLLTEFLLPNLSCVFVWCYLPHWSDHLYLRIAIESYNHRYLGVIPSIAEWWSSLWCRNLYLFVLYGAIYEL
jgi:hypothetical protein